MFSNKYHVCGLLGSDFNLVNLVKIAKLTVHHYQAIYTASMGFFPYSTQNHQFKILSWTNHQIFDSPIISLTKLVYTLCTYICIFNVPVLLKMWQKTAVNTPMLSAGFQHRHFLHYYLVSTPICTAPKWSQHSRTSSHTSWICVLISGNRLMNLT